MNQQCTPELLVQLFIATPEKRWTGDNNVGQSMWICILLQSQVHVHHTFVRSILTSQRDKEPLCRVTSSSDDVRANKHALVSRDVLRHRWVIAKLKVKRAAAFLNQSVMVWRTDLADKDHRVNNCIVWILQIVTPNTRHQYNFVNQCWWLADM